MVQISFPALTNAQVVSGGGGSGQTVTAINNTQNTYSVDDMVFMNYRTANITAQSNIQNYIQSRKYIPFLFNNIFYFRDGYNQNNISMRRRDYNVDTNTWTDSDVSLMGSGSDSFAYPRNILGENCLCIYANSYNTLSQSSQGVCMYYLNNEIHKILPNGIYYIGRNKAIKITQNKISLINYNINNDEIGSTIKEYNLFYYFCGVYYDNNKIFILSGNTSLDNCFLIDDTENTTIIKNYSFGLQGSPAGLTGIDVGDYLIFSVGSVQYNLFDTFGTMQIYKFDAEYNLLLADDLPDTLNALTNKMATCYYDSNSKILTVGTQDEVYAFKFDDITKKFNQIDIGFSIKDLTLPVNKIDGSYYGFQISEDLTMCVIYFKYNTNNAYAEIFLINDTKRGWTIVNNPKQLSISGKVNKVNNDGTYEVSTVLPKKLTLSISVTPDTDDITVDGAIQ